ncbi:MAG TPA: bifunctional diguanylate cyclase/phosphodiesterase [Novosphingobium sp.]|nr:bifunctional diguanylate cyclase/phosphodiesterase [Novosphingobium sp.]
MDPHHALPDDDPRDAVTGLPGADAVRRRLDDWREAGGETSVHALLLGLRRIDALNLAYGAASGDGVLAEVAARIAHFAADELDGPSLVARAGGGAFLVLASEPCSRERWQLFAEQLARVVSAPVGVPGGLVNLSPRLALVRALAGEEAESLLDRLGQTLEGALRQSGRRIAWADGETTRAGRTSARLEADLLRAIGRGEIEVLYQPQYRCADDGLCGAEALARWNHPRLGRIGAGALFAIAERADHVVPLSRHIAALALSGAQAWPAGLRLSVNVTPAELAVAGHGEELARMIAASGFDPARLTLEVTEQALLADIQLARATLGELAGQGIAIALDDFGAGFCNFRYLKLLPLACLKLDRTMIDGVADDPRDLAVLRGIVAMARALDLDVVAEGVESEAQRAMVAAEGCASYQGFLRAAPMSVQAFGALAAG